MGPVDSVAASKTKGSVLSLENCILPPVKLYATPSFLDGLDSEIETIIRIVGCQQIQASGILLRLPQIYTMASVFLASKIEEAPRKILDVVNVFHHIKQLKSGKNVQVLIVDEKYAILKEEIIRAERRLLKALGFCVRVKHPYKIIFWLLEILEVKSTKLIQTAWNYANDALQTDIFVRFSPETIAQACICLSARVLQIPLSSNPPWYEIFGGTEREILVICNTIISLYTRHKPNEELLQKNIEKLKRHHSGVIQVVKKVAGGKQDKHNISPSYRPQDKKLKSVIHVPDRAESARSFQEASVSSGRFQPRSYRSGSQKYIPRRWGTSEGSKKVHGVSCHPVSKNGLHKNGNTHSRRSTKSVHHHHSSHYHKNRNC